MEEVIKVSNDYHFMSEFLDELPSHYLINKGITGCGGTTLELQSKRDSIILCPTKNLVRSKMALGYFGVTGDVPPSRIKDYLLEERGYKKILATYDALEKLMKTIPYYEDYFLLIDEYHLLFNDYSFRIKAVTYILNNFRKFKNWAFITATPLKEECILNELKDVNQITYEWENAVPVKMNIIDTNFVQKELINLINKYQDRNLHIFLNSVNTIDNVAEQVMESYRVVCSDNSKRKVEGYAKITDPIKRLNFYTSCAFEGADIYDPDGFIIVACDTRIATTILDISTKMKQICGRIRDSKYKDQCTLILNTNRHRYAGVSKHVFAHTVEDSMKVGLTKMKVYNDLSPEFQSNEVKFYSKDTYVNYYINTYENRLFYDPNLKRLDIYNYHLVSDIYNNAISVLTEAAQVFEPVIKKREWKKQGLDWIRQELYQMFQDEFEYAELEEVFRPLFKQYNLVWDKNNSIKKYFPAFTKRIKKTNGKKSTIYKFAL